MAPRRKPANKKRKRNYRKEYDDYQGKPDQKKRRAQRNAARAKMAKAGRVKKGDGKDVDHKKSGKHGKLNNSSSNLRVMSASKNRSMNKKKKKTKKK